MFIIIIFNMAKWGLLKSVILIVLAGFLSTGIVTYLPGDYHFNEKQAGLFSGILHGILAPLTLIGMIFTDLVMFEVRNNGWWYSFGFLFGILITWSGGKGTSHVIKNYYGKKESKGLTEEDHKKIGKMIEEKVTSTIKPKKKIVKKPIKKVVKKKSMGKKK